MSTFGTTGGAGGTSDGPNVKGSTPGGAGGGSGVSGTAGTGQDTGAFDGSGGGGGGPGAAGGAGGDGGSGAYAPGGVAGTAGVPGGAGGNGGDATFSSGTYGPGGGGGGGGGTARTISNAATITANVTGGAGGNGGASTAGGGGGGGAGGDGIDSTGSVTIVAGVTVQGGAGGAGGNTGTSYSNGGQGGGGGVGFSGSGSLINAGTILTGAAGISGSGNGVTGVAAAGFAAVFGNGLSVMNTGTITGNTGADAITFTGGTNALTLSANGTQGTLNGTIGVTGSLAIDPGTGAGVKATLANTIHDTTNGAGSISKIGTGTLVLSAVNTYTGTTTVSAGTLQAGSAGALGTNSAVIDNATLDLGGFSETIGSLSGSGIVTDTGAPATLTTGALNTATTFSGTIQNGTGVTSLTKAGTGTLTLSGANTYTGVTLVSAGTLKGGATNALSAGSAVTDNATLDLGGFNEAVGSLSGTGIVTDTGAAATLTAGALNTATTFSGRIQNGTGVTSLTKAGTGTLTLSGANTYTGATTVSAGTLKGGVTNAFGAGSAVTDNATLDLGGFNQSINTLQGFGTVTDTGANATLTIANTIPNYSPFYGVIQNGTGVTSLDISSGSQALAGTETYTGTTTIEAGASLTVGNQFTTTDVLNAASAVIDNGYLAFNANNPLGGAGGALTIANSISGSGRLTQNSGNYSITLTGTNTYTGNTDAEGHLIGGVVNAFGTNSAVIVGASGTLDLGGYNQTIGSLSTSSTAAIVTNNGAQSATLTIGNDGTSTSFAGSIKDGTKTLALTKVGAGTLTLSGTDSYTGGTTLAGGTLELASATAAGGTMAAPGAVAFTTAAASLQLDAAAVAKGGSATGIISGFQLGDTLDLRGLTYASDDTATLSGGVLTVGDATTSDRLTSFSLAAGQTPYFVASSDGHGGTKVTLQTQPAAPTGVTVTPSGQPYGTAVTVSGTGDAAGDMITLYGAEAGTPGATTVLGTTNVASDGTLGFSDSVPGGALPDGTFIITATDTTAGGTTSSLASSAVTVVVAANAPTDLAQTDTPVTGGMISVTGNTIDAAADTVAIYATPTTPGADPTFLGDAIVTAGTNGGPNSFSFTSTQTFENGQYTITATDTSVDGTESASATTLATVAPVAPSIANTTPAGNSTNESVVSPFSNATVTDSNAASGSTTAGTATDTLTITLEDANGNALASGVGGTLSGAGQVNPDGTYTLTGTGMDITTELEAVTFTPNQGANNTSFTTYFGLSDTSSVDDVPATDATSQVTDTDPAVAPTITGTTGGQATTSEAPDTTVFSGVTVADSNANGAPDTLTITLSGGTGGTLSEGDGFGGSPTLTPTGASYSYTLSGTAAAITAELDNLVFTPNAGQANTSATTTFALSDLSSAGTTSTTDTTTTVTDIDPAVAPTITGTTGGQTTTSEAPDTTVFSGVTVADLNANGAPDTLTITLLGNGGTLSEGEGFGGSPTLTPTGASYSYTLTGTAKDITAELDNLVFTPDAGQPNTSPTTTFALSDTSSAGTTSATDYNTTVTDIDPPVAPTITGTKGGQTTTSEAPDTTVFSGVTVMDPNANGIPASTTPALTLFSRFAAVVPNPYAVPDTLTITLSGGNGGTLSDGMGFGGTPALTQTGANTYALSGTAKDITAELDTLVFTPNAGQANTSSTTTFALTDTSSAGTTSSTDTTTTATDIDPPVAPSITGTVAGQATTSEQPLKPFSGVIITDPNANATDAVTIQLSNNGAGGTLSGTGLIGGQNGTYTLATGTAASVTAALEQLVFTPHAGPPNTQATTTFTLTDQTELQSGDNSVPGPSASDAKTSVIDTDPPVGPTISGAHATATTAEAVVTPFSGVTLADANAGSTDALTIALSGSGGTLSGSGLTQTGATTYSLATGTAAQVTAFLDALTFTPVAGAPGTSSTTGFTLSDTTSAGTGASNAGTSVTDTDPPVAPTLSGTHATATTAEAAVTPFSGVTLADANAGATDALTIALSGGGGTLSGSGLTQTEASTYSLATGTAAQVTAFLDALTFTPVAGAPGTSSTTGFTLSDTTSAGTGASNAGTSVTDTAAPAIVPPPVVLPPPTNNRIGDTTPPIVAFSPAVSFSSPTLATFTGTAFDDVAVASVQVYEGSTNLGAATLNGDGSWSLTTDLARGFHAGFVAVATDSSGNSTSAPATFDLTTGVKSPIPGQPYTAVQDRFDTAGNFLGQTFFKRHGAVLFSSSFAPLPDGGLSYTYSGGTFFNDKPYSSFTDDYTAPGIPASVEILNNNDGSHTIAAQEPGVILHSIGSDTLVGAGSSDRFVFSPGFGHDTITDFVARGAGHDTLVLPNADASHLAQILASAHTVNGDTTFHVNRQDSITLQGVTLAELKTHQSDFKFQA